MGEIPTVVNKEIWPQDLLVPEGFVYTRQNILSEVLKAVNGPRYPGYPESGLKMTPEQFSGWESAGRPVETLIGSTDNRTDFFVEKHGNRYLPDGTKRSGRIQSYGGGEFFPQGKFDGLITASDGSPLNPFFREIVTSPDSKGFITGPGWYWTLGPNPAADPFIERIHNGKLQFIAIKRHDDKVFALPGGMKEGVAGLSKTAKAAMELSTDAAAREAGEEASVVGLDKARTKVVLESVPVGDLRLTAQSWPITTVVRFTLTQELSAQQKLKAGDDAMEVKWMDASEENVDLLFASHPSYVRLCIQDWQKETGMWVDKNGNIGFLSRI